MVDRNVFSPFARDFSDGRINPLVHLCKLAPALGFEPTTNRLIPTVSGLYHCATISPLANGLGSGAQTSMT